MNWKFWQSEDNSNEKPPKPEVEDKSKVTTKPVYRVEIEYRNGDTETFESFGRKPSNSPEIRYRIPPISYKTSFGGVMFDWDSRTVNYEVLAREPVETKIRDEKYRLTWTEDFKLKFAELSYKKTKWKASPKNVGVELVDIDER